MPFDLKYLDTTARVVYCIGRTRNMRDARAEAKAKFDLDKDPVLQVIFNYLDESEKWTFEEFRRRFTDREKIQPSGVFEVTTLGIFCHRPSVFRDLDPKELREACWLYRNSRVYTPVLTVLEAHQGNRRSEFENSLFHLGELTGYLRARAGDPVRDLLRVAACMMGARSALLIGRTTLARQLLDEGKRVAEEWGFVSQLGCATIMGKVLHAEGKLESALEQHLDRKKRQFAKRVGYNEWLYESHTHAAVESLHLGREDLARRELSLANKLVKCGGKHHLRVRGYALLLGAEVTWRAGKLEDAYRQFDQAIAFFDSLPVPFAQGKLHAYLALARLRAREGRLDEVRNAIDRAEPLLPEMLNVFEREAIQAIIRVLEISNTQESAALAKRLIDLVWSQRVVASPQP